MGVNPNSGKYVSQSRTFVRKPCQDLTTKAIPGITKTALWALAKQGFTKVAPLIALFMEYALDEERFQEYLVDTCGLHQTIAYHMTVLLVEKTDRIVRCAFHNKSKKELKTIGATARITVCGPQPYTRAMRNGELLRTC